MGDYSKELWYIGRITRAITNELLLNKKEGLYLVRDSSTCTGDYVLCVSENHKVSNYIIKSKPNGCFQIGENVFNSLHSVLRFYTDNLLDTTTLKDIVVIEKVRGKYDFGGRDEEDLPFQKGELLYVIEKPEDQWWEALNQEGKIGSIPAPYVSIEQTNGHPKPEPIAAPAYPTPLLQQPLPPISAPPPPAADPPPNDVPAHLASPGAPITAIAIMDRNPSAYDPKWLKFRAGDVIRVTRQYEDGLWEGECNGQKGLFPFNHVKIESVGR